MVPLIPNTFLGFLLCVREQNSIYSFYLSLRLTLNLALGRLLNFVMTVSSSTKWGCGQFLLHGVEVKIKILGANAVMC